MAEQSSMLSDLCPRPEEEQVASGRNTGVSDVDIEIAGSQPRKLMTERFLHLAAEQHRHMFDADLVESGKRGGWARLQQSFLKMIDDYIEVELLKPSDGNAIDKHEAGGQWRIGYSHLGVRADKRILEKMVDVLAARRRFTDQKFIHGFPDCQETHHEIETFIYFQNPLSYLKVDGSAAAIDSMEDVAHHVGNWVSGIPAWYDWDKHGFVSTWLGTRAAKNYPPYDYQEANHWRHMGNVMATYMGTGRQRYLDVITDYAGTWCNHIEKCAAANEPIRCSILPENVKTAAEGYGRYQDVDLKHYKVFYSTVATNTAYDVAGVLLDVYRVTGNTRCLKAVEAMMDQFYAHGKEGRPAVAFKDGEWKTVQPSADPDAVRWNAQDVVFIARMSMRYDMVTGSDTYRQRVLDWAKTIDEDTYDHDSMVADLMVAAHYYTGNSSWLDRGYAMALRAAAVAEADDHPHQCNTQIRQGSKFLMELLYQPLFGGCEAGTRGNIPVRRLKHVTHGVERLPHNVSFRTWRIDDQTDGFEAINLSRQPVQWNLLCSTQERDLLAIEAGGKPAPEGCLSLKPGASVAGRLTWHAGLKPVKPC
jgi:hypothetical protein